MRLYLVASRPTDAVTYGFLPAAARLGLEVTVLTDQPAAHARVYAERPVIPTIAGEAEEYPPPRIEPCDVWHHPALISVLAGQPAPDGLFSNSDHLQAQTALAASYLGLPGKDWRSALRAKHKPLMRRTLAAAGAEQVGVTEFRPADVRSTRQIAAAGLEYPVVLKPADGVASEDVVLVEGPEQLREFSGGYFRRHPAGTLMAEEYLPGPLRTMETLGDGVTRWVLGGFRTTVSKPPFFAEERLDWDTPATADRAHVGAVLDTLGVSFGACHTEYVTGRPALDQRVSDQRVSDQGARLIEVNDRVIGDHCEFLLAHLTGLPLFELILKVHLGERLPRTQPLPPHGREHGAAAWIFAEQSGVLAQAPPAVRHATIPPGVMLRHWPLRRPGDEIIVTGTNRDYLGVIVGAGPDQAAVAAAVDDLHGRLHYVIRPREAG